jgi:RNA polymerase sigma factor (sigma-70 family)
VQTDEQLARDVQRGITSSMNTLIERHYALLMGYLYRMSGGQRTLAEDMAQETFLHALRSIQQYQYPRPFKAWLYAIATNLARNHYKRADTRYTDSADEDFELVADESLPEDSAQANDEARTVALALAALPDHQREVVVLYYYQELALAEIADALNIPIGTVKSRLSIGLRRLRTIMEKQQL